MDNRNIKNDIIAGRNPVFEAVKSGRSIDKILIAKGAKNGAVIGILAKAKERKIPVKEVDSKKLDFLSGGAVHQGIVATASVKESGRGEKRTAFYSGS